MLIANNLHAKCRLCHGICFLLGVRSCLGTLTDGLQRFGKSGVLLICWHFHFDPCLVELISLCIFLHRAEAAKLLKRWKKAARARSEIPIQSCFCSLLVILIRDRFLPSEPGLKTVDSKKQSFGRETVKFSSHAPGPTISQGGSRYRYCHWSPMKKNSCWITKSPSFSSVSLGTLFARWS